LEYLKFNEIFVIFFLFLAMIIIFMFRLKFICLYCLIISYLITILIYFIISPRYVFLILLDHYIYYIKVMNIPI